MFRAGAAVPIMAYVPGIMDLFEVLSDVPGFLQLFRTRCQRPQVAQRTISKLKPSHLQVGKSYRHHTSLAELLSW